LGSEIIGAETAKLTAAISEFLLLLPCPSVITLAVTEC
jgi:hypothetical protein